MALTLFSRRPEPVEPPAPEPWPEMGETWKPGSFFALRGLSLGPRINIHHHPAR